MPTGRVVQEIEMVVFDGPEVDPVDDYIGLHGLARTV